MQLTCSQYAVCLSLAGIFGGKLLPLLHPLPLPRFSIIGSKYLHVSEGLRGFIRRGRDRARPSIVFVLSAVRSQTTESVDIFKYRQFPHSVRISFPRLSNKGPVQQDLFPLKVDAVSDGRLPKVLAESNSDIQIAVPRRLDAHCSSHNAELGRPHPVTLYRTDPRREAGSRKSWMGCSYQQQEGSGYAGEAMESFVDTPQRKLHLCIPRKGMARHQSQFPHSCICERFLYSQDRSTHFPAAEQGRPILVYINPSQTHKCGNWD